MIRVPSNVASYKIWENGFDLLTFLIAQAAPELSETYQAACDSACDGTQGESDSLTDLHGVLQKAQGYNHIDTLYLEHKGYLVVDYPFGHWSSHRSLYRLLRSDVLVGFGFIKPPRDARGSATSFALAGLAAPPGILGARRGNRTGRYGPRVVSRPIPLRGARRGGRGFGRPPSPPLAPS